MKPSAPPALSRSSYDRAVERRTDEQWLAAAWERARVLVVGADGTADVRAVDGPGGSSVGLDLRQPADAPEGSLRVFLGVDGDAVYFAALDLSEPEDADRRGAETRSPGVSRAGLRAVGAELDDVGSGLFVSAIALRNWHLRHPCCPRCGTPTEAVQGGWVRECPADGSLHFPRTDPAAIMLIHDGDDRCVLGRQAVWPSGRYSILAGFVDPGESAEAAVAREVGEEVGIAITDITYVASQPWPFPASIMLGFTARVDGDPTLRVDHNEIEDAQWFTRAQLRESKGTILLPSPVSIAYRLITDWLADG